MESPALTPGAIAPERIAPSPWAPFHHKTYAVIWGATLVSNIGSWMYSSASGWLMTNLTTDPLMVSLVQVAASLPIFLFALPAGALTDILDKRQFLIGAEIYISVASTVFAVMVWLGLVNPWSLLAFTFLIEAGSAATSPPWQSIGAFALPWLKSTLGANGVVTAGTVGTALTLIHFGIARGPGFAVAASVIAGVSWIAVLANLNVSEQVALPDWVRGRGLALYVTVFFGAMTLGSAIWGEVARFAGVPAALLIAAAGILLAIPLTWRWKLQTGAGVDLTPSMHWPTPVLSESVESDAGPVLITVEYLLAASRSVERS